MKWSEETLGEIADRNGGEVKTGPFGSQLHQSDYSDDGSPVVMPKNIIAGRVDETGIARVGQEHSKRLKHHQLQIGDIVYGRRGDIGRCALITEREEGWLCGTGCLKLNLGNGEVDPLYLFFFLNHPATIEWIFNQAVGATMPNLNTSILRSVPIKYPPLRIQRRIARILSAYDDLIEVNTRRIKVLEEMARRTYEEWFVRARNNAKASRSEWKWTTLGDYCSQVGGSIQTGPFGSQLHRSDYLKSGTPVVMPKNIIGGRIDQNACAKISPEMTEKLQRHALVPGDIVFARRGDIGRKARIRENDAGCICGTGCLKVMLSDPRAASHYVSYFFDEQETIQALAGRAIGATMPNLNTQILSGMPFPIPPLEWLGKFESMSETQDVLANNLAIQNTNLRAQRDFLLPRLVSGAIDVSEAETAPHLLEKVAAE